LFSYFQTLIANNLIYLWPLLITRTNQVTSREATYKRVRDYHGVSSPLPASVLNNNIYCRYD